MKRTFMIVVITFNILISYSQPTKTNGFPGKSIDAEFKSVKYFNKAVQCIKTDSFSYALGYLNATINIDSTFSKAWLERSKVKLKLNQLDESLNDVNKYLQLEAKSGEGLYIRGTDYFRKSLYKQAVEDFTKAVSAGFAEPMLYYQRGVISLINEDYNGAILDFTFAIDKRFNFSVAYHDRASAKYKMKDYKGAVSDYEKAIEYQPVFPLAYSNMGNVYRDLGKDTDAILAYSNAIRQDSLNLLGYNDRGQVLYKTGKWVEAIADYKKCLKINPDYIPAMNNMAVALTAEKDYDNALGTLNKVIDLNGDFGEAYINRGYIKELKGDMEGACLDWKLAERLGMEQAGTFLKDCK